MAQGNGSKKPKKTPPTTVRFSEENHAFVKARGPLHPDGQSGVIEDAVTFYRKHQEEKGRAIYGAITGGGLGDEAQDA